MVAPMQMKYVAESVYKNILEPYHAKNLRKE